MSKCVFLMQGDGKLVEMIEPSAASNLPWESQKPGILTKIARKSVYSAEFLDRDEAAS